MFRQGPGAGLWAVRAGTLGGCGGGGGAGGRPTPVAFGANLHIGEIPYTPPTFAGGQAPTLSASEIDEAVAFLCTLTDGYDPSQPAAYNVPTQCLSGAH
jgi:hypothetical protein